MEAKEGSGVEEEAVNEITKFNYEEKLKDLIEKIGSADFVAVDGTVETTGFLMKDEEFNKNYMGDVENCFGSWYDTIKDKEKGACLLEIGIALFTRDKEGGRVKVEVFNIPVLPACVDDNENSRFRGRTCVRVMIDGYGKQFMEQVGFDINKSFYSAAPYLNKDLVGIADDYMKENPTFMVASRKRTMNRYLMPEIYEEVGEAERKVILERLRGVSTVFEAIVAAKIPVVGHNMLLKMIFIYKDFVEYLPDTYPQYLDKMEELFGVVYDTKEMAQEVKGKEMPRDVFKRLSDHKLYNLLRNLNEDIVTEKRFKLDICKSSQSFIEDAEDISAGMLVEEDSKSYCYVAGFDALVSGMIFLDMIDLLEANKIGLDDASSEPEDDVKSADYYEMFMKGLPSRFTNKLFGAPEVPSFLGDVFLEMTDEKREMRRKFEAEEKRFVNPAIIHGTLLQFKNE